MKKQGNACRKQAKYLFIFALLISLLNSNLFLNLLSSRLFLNVANASSEKGVLFGDSLLPYGKMMMDNLLQKVARRDKSCGPEKEISVCVVGEVEFPGQYELCPPATVLTAYASAGGAGLRGSTRFVKVFKGDFCQAFDLYDYYSTGKDATSQLSGGETLVVEKKKAVVRISGAVGKPSIFELLPQEMTAAKVLEMAGGIVSEGFAQIRFDIYRVVGDSVRHFISREISRSELVNELSLIKLHDGDRLYVKAVIDSNLPVKIELKGAFHYPGELVVKDTTRLGDVITLESLLPGFAGEYAELLRISPQSEEYELISFSIDRLLSGEASADLELQNGDRIVVFSREDFSRTAKVAIEQDLHGKQVFLWRPGLRLSEMVQMAGGLERDGAIVGELIRKKITSAGIETSTIIVDLKKLWSNDERYDLQLEPYDLLLIKGNRAK